MEQVKPTGGVGFPVAGVQAAPPANAIEVDNQTEAAQILADLANIVNTNQSDRTGLETAILLKRAECLVKEMRLKALREANLDFSEMRLRRPGVKSFSFAGAVIKIYAPRKEWTYPTAIKTKEESLKADKLEAQRNGTATYRVTEVDLAKDSTFSISLSND
jgi:hypothetical protein